MRSGLAKTGQRRQNEAMMKRLILVFLFQAILTAVCGVHAFVPDPAEAYSFESSKTLVPRSLSGWIICHNDPINKVDPTGENIGAITSVPVIDVIVGIPSIVGTLGPVGLIVAVVAVPMAMKEMVAPGPSIEESEPWEVDSSTCLAEAAADTDLPVLDETGKTHGDLPKVEDFDRHAPEELAKFAENLKQSVKQRIEKTIELGSDKGHGKRQAAEQRLVKNIEKYLKNLGTKWK